MIVLDKVEQAVFRTLLECVGKHKLDITLRVAGGWVRDKLLGLSSHDIDIAIDKMMGRRFVEEYLVRHLRAFGNATCADDGLPGGNNHPNHYGVIKSNPEKSKHLETATIMVHGVWVDFVNLRSEEYASDAESTVSLRSETSNSNSNSKSSTASRIPTKIAFGSPLQDANRRDITINALFYNLHTKQVEDWTGKGVEDLQSGTIRTPLDPLVTLMDDPLRLLRVIRFAARFKYSIVKELWEAMQSPLVADAFTLKVSRERVGIEVDKMLSSRLSVAEAMGYLCEGWVYQLLFPFLAGDFSPNDLYSQYMKHVHQYDSSRLAAYAVLCLPLRMIDSMSGRGKVRLNDSCVFKAMRDYLKLPSKDATAVAKVVLGVEPLLLADLSNPIEIGRAIRQIGEDWRLAVHLCDILHSGEKSKVLFAAVERFNLTFCYQMKPLIRGDELRDIFSLPNERISEYLDLVMDQQLQNPNVTRDDILLFLNRNTPN